MVSLIHHHTDAKRRLETSLDDKVKKPVDGKKKLFKLTPDQPTRRFI